MLFFKKKEDKLPKIEYNSVFGKVKFTYNWWTDNEIVFNLFGKDYPMKMSIKAENKNDYINLAQEQAYIELYNHISELQEKVEHLLKNRVSFPEDCEITDVLTGAFISFAKDGKCGMMIDVAYEYLELISMEDFGIFMDNSFGISLLPNVFLVNNIDDFENLFE